MSDASRLRLLEQAIRELEAAGARVAEDTCTSVLVKLELVLADDGRGWCPQCARDHAVGTPSAAMGSGRR